MATKIRGWKWEFTYRGFELYKRVGDINTFQAIPADLPKMEGAAGCLGQSIEALITHADAFWAARGAEAAPVGYMVLGDNGFEFRPATS